MIRHLRLQEYSDIVSELAATREEKAKANKQRIMAKTLFGLKGSATGEESKRMLVAKHAKAQTEKQGEPERNEKKNQAS